MQTMARTRAANGNFKPNDDYEKMQFYYHPDHLGNSSYITNLDGEVSLHIEYVPFGEVFIEERNNTWNTPYLFNAKEFDEETGLYYYGARYYEPRLSLWMSTDPLEEKYPNVNSYAYCHNNPILLVDKTGMGDGSHRDNALTIIDKFAKEKKTSTVFPYISKNKFVEDLTYQIKHPTSVQQGTNGTCGAAAISKYMVEEQPELYAQTAISLYTTGKATNNGYSLTVTEDMKNGTESNLKSVGMRSVDAIMQGAITNKNNAFSSFNPFAGESGASSFMYPSFVEEFLKSYVGAKVQVVSSFPTMSFMKQINYGEKFVIGLVHHTAEGHIGDGFPNHYIQMTGMDNSNYVHYWTWGESTTRESHVFGNIHGIYQIYLIDR